MRLIDADAMAAKYPNCRGLLQKLEKEPTVDAVQVVRCKDCIYCDKTRRFMWKGISKYSCIVHDMWCKEDYFCAYGERKENGQTD